VGTGVWGALVGSWRIQAGGNNAENVVNNATVRYTTGQVCRRFQCDWRNLLDSALLAVLFRVSDVNNYFFIEPFTFGNTIWLKKKVGGVTTPLASASPTINNTTWYTVWVTDDGNEINIYHAAQSSPKPAVPIITYSDTDLAANQDIGMEGHWAQQRWDNWHAWPSLQGDWA
jgi:hypothetical protein